MPFSDRKRQGVIVDGKLVYQPEQVSVNNVSGHCKVLDRLQGATAPLKLKNYLTKGVNVLQFQLVCPVQKNMMACLCLQNYRSKKGDAV